MDHKGRDPLFVVRLFDQFLVAAIMAWVWRDLSPGTISRLAAFLAIPLWSYLHRYFGLYDSHRLEGWRSVATRTLTASIVGFFLIATALLSTGLSQEIDAFARFTIAWIAIMLTTRGLLYAVLRTIRKHGVDRRYVCVIGSWEKAAEIAGQFQRSPEWGLQVSTVGVGDPGNRKFFRFSSENAVEETIGEDLEQVMRGEVVDEVIITTRPENVSAERSAIEFCKDFGVQCRLQLHDDELESVAGENIRGQMTWTVHDVEVNSRALWMKRIFDIVISSIMLLILSPVFLLVAAFVKLSSPGPVFFRQTRTGLRGRKFVLVKFRTMIVGAESMLQLVAHRNITGGPIFKDAKDWRVTPIGRILRRFSLDELPQLFNVLKGDMSLVGPRPLPVHESVAINGTHRRRFQMRPGITCRWQVEGRNDIAFSRWMELDLEYVDNWSLREDMKLLIRTIPAVLSGRGAY